MSEPINIIIVEDHLGYRETLIEVLRQVGQIKPILDFSTAEIALRKLEKLPPNQVPDLLLLDRNLPGMSGLQSIAWFKKHVANLKIIILTQSATEENFI
jgi:DNA-binding NarL/FixJ family response regulator